jgi:hypothetical protein
MKHTILLASILSLISTSTKAQTAEKDKPARPAFKFELGAKAGMSFSKYADVPKSEPASAQFGVFSALSKGRSALHLEALINTGYESPFHSSENKSLWVGIPLLYSYNIVSRIQLQAGPQLAAVLNSSHDNPTSKPFLAAVIGAEVRPWKGLAGGARYLAGLTNAYEVHYYDGVGNPLGTSGGHMSSFQVYIGYRIL